VHIDAVNYLEQKSSPGIIYGLVFPFTESQLMDFGPQWLTTAFQASGVLDKTNQVVEVIRENVIKLSSGGNCAKFFFQVRYAKPEPHLHTQLFAKVPYPMAPHLREDRITSSVTNQPNDFYEINASRLLEAKFPMKTPKYYFGDISSETSNFILIQERVNFAEIKGRRKIKGRLDNNEIEGPYEKYTDFQLRGPPRDYYVLLMRQTGKMAGMYKTGRFGGRDFIKANFRFPPGGALDPQAFGFNPHGVSGLAPQEYTPKLDTAQRYFGESAKSLFPKYTNKQSFGNRLFSTMMTYNAYAAEIEYYLNTDPDYTALGHMNLSVDNAYFWRDDNGELDCGILDLGGFGVAPVAAKLYKILNCADFDDLQVNLDSYLGEFITAYEESGGPKLDPAKLRLHLFLAMYADMSHLIGTIPNLLEMCPARDLRTVKDFHDPRVADNVDGKSTLRASIGQMLTGVRMIQEMDGEAVLQAWVKNVYEGQFGQHPKSDGMIWAR
jgi:hypothetical protein